jgi:hypothetical protein
MPARMVFGRRAAMRRFRTLPAIVSALALVLAPLVSAAINAPSASAANITAPGVIHLGDSVSGLMSDASASDQYTFSVTAPNSRAYFVRTGNACSCTWSLAGPNGTVFSQSWTDVGPTPLVVGAYVLTVTGDGTNTGTYSFDTSTVPDPQSYAISVGETISDGSPSSGAGNIESPGAEDRYTFSVAGAIDLHMLANDCGCEWSLRSSTGALDHGFTKQGLGDVSAPLTAGSYVLTVTGNGPSTGTYSFALTAVPDAQTFGIAPGDTVSDGTPMTGAGNIETPGATDEYTFTLGTASRVYLNDLANACGCDWSLRASTGSLANGFAVQSMSDVGPTPLPAGSYVLTVTGSGSSTGTYSFALTAVPSAQTFAIALGDIVSDGIPTTGAGNIESPGSTDRYTFSVGTSGPVDLHDIDGSCSCTWSLRSSAGSFEHGFVQQGLTDIGPLWLPADSYVLTVSGSGAATGTYSFELAAVPSPQTFAITLGATITDGNPAAGAGNIESPGATDKYTFNATAGSRIGITSLGCTTPATYVLSAPSGRQLLQGNVCGAGDVLDLPGETGQYSLSVGGGTVNVGTYSLQIATSAASPTLILPPAQVSAISIGGTGAGNLPSASAVDDYTFAGGTGQIVNVSKLSGPACCALTWQIFAPDGTTIGAYPLDPAWDLRVPLTQNGTYELAITGAASAYSFSFDAAPPSQTFAIAIGSSVQDGVPSAGAGNIEFAGSDDEYAFNGTAGQVVRFNDQGTSAAGQLYWQVFAPDGTQLAANWLGSTIGQQFTLPATGQYTISVNAYNGYYYYGYNYGYYGTATGTYQFSLTAIPDAQVFPISIGDSVGDGTPAAGAGNIEFAGSDDEYPFNGTAGQVVRFNDQGTSAAGQLYWQIYAPDGTQLGANWFGNSPGQQLTLPATGQYTIRVNDYYDYYYGYYGTATGTYDFSLTAVPDAQVFPISIGDLVADGVPASGAGRIEAPGSEDDYAFTGTAGQTIRFNDTGTLGCCTIEWQLYAPDGTPLGGDWLGGTANQQFTLTETGQYTIRVNSIDNGYTTATGAYGFSVDIVPLVVPAVTAPITAFISAGQNAVWTVGIQNASASPLQSVQATLQASSGGALTFDESAMPGCSAGTGSTEVCTLADIPAHTTKLFSVFVKTDGLPAASPVTGSIDVSANGVPDATGALGAVTIASCGPACVLTVAAPGVAVSSTSGPPTAAFPTKQVLLLPANQPGATLPAIPAKLASITPSSTEIASDKKLCPTATGTTHCTGQISAITAKFGKYVDPAHPIRVTVVARWGSTTPTGRILMEKDAGGDPLFLIPCALDSTTHQYNTPCVLPETHTGSTATGNLITTDIILFTGVDIHFARRISGGGTIINPPGAPTAVKAAPGSSKATLTWTAPTATNGAGVTGYVVTVLSGGTVVKKVTYASNALTEAVTGLTNGKAYTFKVAATNVAGTGTTSTASASIIVGAPGAPTAVTASRTAAGSLKVAFTAPPNNGAAITGYTATCTSTNGGVTKTKTGTAGPLTVTGLTAGSTYKCTVKATNSRGTGPASVASQPVVA